MNIKLLIGQMRRWMRIESAVQPTPEREESAARLRALRSASYERAHDARTCSTKGNACTVCRQHSEPVHVVRTSNPHDAA